VDYPKTNTLNLPKLKNRVSNTSLKTFCQSYRELNIVIELKTQQNHYPTGSQANTLHIYPFFQPTYEIQQQSYGLAIKNTVFSITKNSNQQPHPQTYKNTTQLPEHQLIAPTNFHSKTKTCENKNKKLFSASL